jgi:AsmA protein
MKFVKYLLLAIGSLLLLFAIGLGIFIATFDANAYKQELADLVRQKTGRELRFDGDVGLTLYPALGMSLGRLSFANAPGFGERPMLAVEQASVSVDLLSLFRLQPQIAELALDGLKLDLARNARGKTNWDDLVAASPGAAEQPGASEASARQRGDLQLAGVFGGLNLSNADIRWRDDQAGVEYEISDLNLKTGSIEMDRDFPLNLSLRLRGKDGLDAEMSFAARARLGQQALRLAGMNLDVRAAGGPLPVKQALLKMGGDLGLALDSSQLSVQGFSLNADIEGGPLQGIRADLGGDIGFDLERQLLTVAGLSLETDLTGDSLPLGNMKTTLSSSELKLDLPARSLRLDKLQLGIDGQQFEGFVDVADYARPAVRFELMADELDVDRLTGYQPQPAGAAPVEPVQTGSAEDVRIALPVELLRRLELDGQLGIGHIRVHGLNLNQLSLRLRARQGQLSVEPLKLSLYGGTLDGRVGLDVRGRQPAYRLGQKLAGFRIGEFLQDFMQDDRISGKAEVDIDLVTRGEWLSELKQNLNGRLAMRVEDGALKGFNLRYEVARAKARLKKQPEPPKEQQKTDFSALSMTARITDGVLYSNDLNLQAPLLRVGGEGKVDLVSETIDYRVDAKLVGTTKGQGAGGVDDLSGLLVPVAITGSWLNPEINVLYDDLLKADLARKNAELKARVAAEKAELQKKLDAEKAALKAAQEKKAAAEKARLQKELELKQAEEKAKLEEKKKAAGEKAKKKLEDKLKKLF